MVDRRHLIVGVAPVRIPGVRTDVLVATARGVGARRNAIRLPIGRCRTAGV